MLGDGYKLLSGANLRKIARCHNTINIYFYKILMAVWAFISLYSGQIITYSERAVFRTNLKIQRSATFLCKA